MSPLPPDPADPRQVRPRFSLAAGLRQLGFVPRAFRLALAAAPGWTAASLAMLGVRGVLPLAAVFLFRRLVDALTPAAAGGGGGSSLGPALVAVGGLAAVALASRWLVGLIAYAREVLAEQLQDHTDRIIHEKTATLDLSFFESPACHDLLRRASVDATDRPLALVEGAGAMLQHGLTLVVMCGVLSLLAWWLPLLLLASALPGLWSALHATWQLDRWRVQSTVARRRLDYYHRVLTSAESAMEVRLFGLGRHFQRLHGTVREGLREQRLRMSRRQLAVQAGASGAAVVALAGGLAWMIRQVFAGTFSLGELAMFYLAMNEGQQLMLGLLGGLNDLYKNLLYLEDLFAFVDLEPRLADPPAPAPLGRLRDGVRLEGVTFRYPDAGRDVLSDLDLFVPAGRVTAVMGENGAGKSSVLKLLCRFYDPQRGRVTWDGRDLREAARADLRSRVTVLFQHPTAYHETAADNVAYGDLASGPDRPRIAAAVDEAGAGDVVARLPERLETVLGRWFGSTELSTGEWQRLALARAFLRRAELVVLDEPTSAMDPWAEAGWMDRFRELVRGRTAVVITHRLATAMRADTIHVLCDGRFAESGTHEELLARGGRYASSWRAHQEAFAAPRASVPS